MRHGVPEIEMNDDFNFSAMAHLPEPFGSGKCEWKVKTTVRQAPTLWPTGDWSCRTERL